MARWLLRFQAFASFLRDLASIEARPLLTRALINDSGRVTIGDLPSFNPRLVVGDGRSLGLPLEGFKFADGRQHYLLGD